MEKTVTHRQNTQSRKKLVDTARTLFYEQGYTDTTFLQISKISGINNGLITYYFGSKRNLASEIYTAFLLDMRNEIAKQLYLIKKDYKLELGIGLENRIMLDMRFENENLMRFCVEYAQERGSSRTSNEKRDHYYKLQRRLINPSLSDLDLNFYEICANAIPDRLTKAYASKRIDCSTDLIEDYALRMLYTMLQLPPYQIEALIEESRFLQNQLNIKVGPGFRVIGM